MVAVGLLVAEGFPARAAAACLRFSRPFVDAQRADFAVRGFDLHAGSHALPPCICTAASMTRAFSVAVILAIAASRVVGSFCTSRRHAAGR